MAFSVPKHVPSFGNPQRKLENQIWGATGGRQGSILGNVQDRLFDNNKRTLPMYKDKPYGYRGSNRARPIYRRKRVLGLLALLSVALLYFLGAFSSESRHTRRVENLFKSNSAKLAVDWDDRRQKVVDAFTLSWDAYDRYAWGYDEFHPVSKTGRQMAPKGLGWIIVDSLDTLMLMNLTSRLEHAREWIANDLTYDQAQDVNTFETTIRLLGGLLSAHFLSNKYPNMAPLADDDEGSPGEDLYLEKAKDLADRIAAAFDSESGVPFSSILLDKFKGVPSHDIGGASSTAEATTVQLEFKYLSNLTGEDFYWDMAQKAMKVVDDNGAKGGLVPIYISPTTGKFSGNNIRLGSRGDSYYEYLIKQYLQTDKKEPIYLDMWTEALQGVRDYLVTYTEPSQFTIIGERPSGLEGELSPKMDHLVCFMPGTIALAVTEGLTETEARKLPTWSKQREADLQLAKELMQTCWGMYKWMETGLAAEITYFKIGHPPLPESSPHQAPEIFDADPNAKWRQDFDVHAMDRHNLQRPETVESLFYMWRITGEEKYREWGWEMFESFLKYTAVDESGGFSSLDNANVIPPKFRDNMESFWLAETLKYFYLLFSPNDLLPLTEHVFNTEAHPLPIFEMGKLFSTGWERKPRDSKGNIVEKS